MKKIISSLIFVFIMQNAFAYYTENMINKCGVVTNNIHAVFTRNKYSCNLGEFLPANTLGCKPCPDGCRCPGGDFDFNENEFQGVHNRIACVTNNLTNMCAKNMQHKQFAVFKPNVHTCVAGHFLPANIDGCSLCPPDNYCPGGTYTFNETTPQGIEPCPSAHPFAPAGMWTQSQCGRKLHVGDDVLYLHQAPATPTARRLYVRFNDVVYSANATEVAIAPTTLSEYAKRALHVIIDGGEYLIHDDSAK